MTTLNIDRNVEAGLAKLKTAQCHNTRIIRTTLENLQQELKNSGLVGQVNTAKDSHNSITQQLKLYHAHISKYTKVLDKVTLGAMVELIKLTVILISDIIRISCRHQVCNDIMTCTWV